MAGCGFMGPTWWTCALRFWMRLAGRTGADPSNAVCAMVRYNGFGVTLQFVKNNPQNLAVLDFGSHMACVDLEIGQCYPLGMRAFAAMLAGTQPGPPPGFFSSSVALMGAIGSGAEAGKKTEVRSRTDVE